MTIQSVTADDVEAMMDAAFAVLARRHPECTSGDIDPVALDVLTRALRAAAEHWVIGNTPE